MVGYGTAECNGSSIHVRPERSERRRKADIFGEKRQGGEGVSLEGCVSWCDVEVVRDVSVISGQRSQVSVRARTWVFRLGSKGRKEVSFVDHKPASSTLP